jgi:hypothetical protein
MIRPSAPTRVYAVRPPRTRYCVSICSANAGWYSGTACQRARTHAHIRTHEEATRTRANGIDATGADRYLPMWPEPLMVMNWNGYGPLGTVYTVA